MRVAFFGLPLAALLLIEDGHDVVYAAVCRKGTIGTRRLTRLLGSERVQIRPNLADEATFARVAKARPDLIVSWFWTTKIPMRMVALAELGAFGVHPSLLPRHRGPDPYYWAIAEADTETGVTAHRLAAEYDTGAILGAKTLKIHPEWSAWTLAKKLDRPSLALLRETARAFASGTPPQELEQDDSRATPAPEPDDATLRIGWGWPTEKIVRRVRAASPWPGAYTHLGGEELIVTRVAATSDFPCELRPGEAAVVRGRALVRTGDGAVELLDGRNADGDDLDADALAERVSAVVK